MELDEQKKKLLTQEVKSELGRLDVGGVLRWAQQVFGERLCLASSLGVEDQLLTHFIAREAPGIRVFTLDTGRLFPESYDLIDATTRQLGVRIEVFAPERAEVESMVASHGINLFRESVALRKLCCGVRKLGPLRRALQGMDAWICGLRRSQAVTRGEVETLEWDEANGLFKINPLVDWTEEQTWEQVRALAVPYNPLHDRGYPTIGCASCTRAVAPGEDIRAGRFYWEPPEKRECGLHQRPKTPSQEGEG